MGVMRQQRAGQSIQGEDATGMVSNLSMSFQTYPFYPVNCLTDSAGLNDRKGTPIEYEGENAVVNPEFMVPGTLYPFMLFGKWTCALKEDDGTVSLFYVPESG